MSRTEGLRASIQQRMAVMEPIALNWAKIKPEVFHKRTKFLDEMNLAELVALDEIITKIYENSFAEFMKVWRKLPVHQWENTFASGMSHLIEYQDLRKVLAAFRAEFITPFPKVKKKPAHNKA